MEPVRSLLVAGVALCGLAIVILSFMTWVQFDAQEPLPTLSVNAKTNGLDTSIWRDDESLDEHVAAPHGIGWCSCEVGFGDGYLTAALGLMIVAASAVAAVTIFSGRALVVSTVAALATVVIAGFNAFADWSALVSVTDAGTTAAADGTVQFALYAIVAIAGLAAILSVGAWVVEKAYDYGEEYDYEDEFDDEESATGGDSWVSV